MSAWVGLKELDAALTAFAERAEEAARTIVAKASAVVVAAEMRGFQGSHSRNMPHVGGSAPNVVTGSARRSVKADPVRRYGVSTYGTQVGPRIIYARRLELGYRGTDKRGRKYNQPAYPFVAPAIKETQPVLEAIALAEWAKVVPR